MHENSYYLGKEKRFFSFAKKGSTRKIKQHCPFAKIIAQTAYAAIEDRNRALEAGCVDYISKPLKRDSLLTMINKHLLKNKE